jgi:ribonuclease E
MNTEPMAPVASSPSTPSLAEPQPPTRIGNIYLAKVVRVDPALECAFVEFGGARHGSLAFNEIHPDYYQIPVEQRRELVDRLNHVVRNPAVDQLEIQFGEVDDYDDDEGTSVGSTRAVRLQRSNRFKIQDVIKRRQVMLVKVTKDEVENKGAALTTFISISSRFLVLMPNTAMQLHVSGSIPSPEDRLRLTQLGLDIPEGMGVFVRSSAQAIPDAKMVDEFADLVRTWEAVRDLTLKSQAPTLVYDATNKLVPSG